MYNKDLQITIRGYPRDKHAIDVAEQYYGAKLVGDTELDLLLKLDTALARIRMKIAADAKAKGEKPKYPEFLQLPGDENIYLPIPFNVQWFGFTLKSYHKPAWLRVKKHFIIGANFESSRSN